MNKEVPLFGEMAERLNAAVLKTAERDERSVGSNPTLSSRNALTWIQGYDVAGQFGCFCGNAEDRTGVHSVFSAFARRSREGARFP
jgi:hypothetical protein